MPEINQIYANFQKLPQTKVKEPVNQTPPVETKTVDKKKLAVGIAAAVGITALVVGGILYKKKIDSKKVKQLAEHIEFQQFDNLQDAIKFGREHLGIKRYKGFKNADVDVVNWVNEGLVNVNNASKGKAIMPKKIVYARMGKVVDGKFAAMGGMNGYGTLKISKDVIRYQKNNILEYLKSFPEGKYQNLIDQLQKSKNFRDWSNCDINIRKCYFPNRKPTVHTSTFSTIYHEMGHLQHFTNSNLAMPDLNDKFSELLKKNTEIAKKVSSYAATSPCEFVAECYAKMVDGKLSGKKLLSDKALELYKKMGGPVF